MPSFDIVSEVDMHELSNAVDQANREIGNRFDFKGTDSKVEQNETNLVLHSESDFQLKQIMEILRSKLVKRSVDVDCLDVHEPETVGNRARQNVTVQQGIDKDLARKIVKQIKDKKLKVQAAIQGEQVRVSGKKRDDLQQVIAYFKEEKVGIPLQFVNFRD